MSVRLIPPPSVTIIWCPECGRTDRVVPLKPRHWAAGKLCRGNLESITYGWPIATATSEPSPVANLRTQPEAAPESSSFPGVPAEEEQ